MYSGSHQLDSTAATERRSGIGRAGDVSGFSAGLNLVYEVLVLSKLAQLEVANKNVTVASFESVAKFLDGVSVDECASCFALCVDSASYIAEAFAHVIAYTVDVAVGLAAALLCSETVLCNSFASHVETIFHAAIDSIETITNAIGDAAKLTIYILIIKAFKQVGASYCILQFCGTIASE